MVRLTKEITEAFRQSQKARKVSNPDVQEYLFTYLPYIDWRRLRRTGSGSQAHPALPQKMRRGVPYVLVLKGNTL